MTLMNITYINFVFHLHHLNTLTPDQLDFLSKILFFSKFDQPKNVDRSLVELCMNTKLKKNIDEKPTELLIYYSSPIKILPISTSFIEIIAEKTDKHRYKQLSQDVRFSIIGVAKIAKLSIPQVAYINNLINKFKFTPKCLS